MLWSHTAAPLVKFTDTGHPNHHICIVVPKYTAVYLYTWYQVLIKLIFFIIFRDIVSTIYFRIIFSGKNVIGWSGKSTAVGSRSDDIRSDGSLVLPLQRTAHSAQPTAYSTQLSSHIVHSDRAPQPPLCIYDGPTRKYRRRCGKPRNLARDDRKPGWVPVSSSDTMQVSYASNLHQACIRFVHTSVRVDATGLSTPLLFLSGATACKRGVSAVSTGV